MIQTTVDLAIEGDILVRFHKNGTPESIENSAGYVDSSRKMPVYLSVFALAQCVTSLWLVVSSSRLSCSVFQLAMAVDAVYARNTLQFIGLTYVGFLGHTTAHASHCVLFRIFNALLLVYAIIQIFEIRRIVEQIPALDSQGISPVPVSTVTAVLPVVISVAELAYIGLGWKIYKEFGWKVYKFLGADRRIKKMFTSYQIFQCLVKFDVFFWVGFSVQFIWLVLHKRSDWEYYITCAALPVSLILLVEGHLAARHENMLMMVTFMSGCVGALVYFVYKVCCRACTMLPPNLTLVASSSPRSLSSVTLLNFLLYTNHSLLSVGRELVQARTLTNHFAAVIATTLLIMTFVFAVIVMRNFGRGLKASRSCSFCSRIRRIVSPLCS